MATARRDASLPHVSTLSRVDLELKSHKTQVSFLAATSFQLHLSSLISILMGYSCRLAHDSAVRGNANVWQPYIPSFRVRVHMHARVCACTPREAPTRLIPNPSCVSPPPSRIGKRSKPLKRSQTLRQAPSK